MLLDFKKEIILENNRVQLRPLMHTDFDELLFFSLKEPSLWQFSLTSCDGKENLKKYIDTALLDRENNRAYPFLVIDKANGKVAGSTRFYDYQPVHNTIQLGYTWYGSQFQGTGLNKNCKHLLLTQAFDNWLLNRVEFRADNNNKRSINAMKSIGCVKEGVLRSNCDSPSGRRDSIVLSILKNEWAEHKRNNLSAQIEILNT